MQHMWLTKTLVTDQTDSSRRPKWVSMASYTVEENTCTHNADFKDIAAKTSRLVHAASKASNVLVGWSGCLTVLALGLEKVVLELSYYCR